MLRCLMCIMLLFSGCAGQSDICRYPSVETGSPVVYIYPESADLTRASITVLPFNVPDGIDIRQGERVALLFQDVLLGKQAFQRVKVVNRHYGSLEQAIDLAEKAGTDLVLAGKIHYLLSGTKIGGGRIDVSTRVIDVKSGNTVWYIEQSLDQKLDFPDLSVKNRLSQIFSIPATRPPEGAPVVTNMLSHIAVSISDVMAGARTVTKM